MTGLQPLISLIGSDGTGKSFLLQRIQRLSLPAKVAFLPCTDYHSSPYCGHPTLSGALDRISRHADHVGDPMLKAHSLLLKMTLFADELAHLTERLQPEVIFSTRHPVIDTVVYLRVFLENMRLKGRLSEFDHRDLAGLLTEEERTVVDAWTGELRRRHGSANLTTMVAGLHSKTSREQLDALQVLFAVPWPVCCVFLDPAPEALRRQLQRKSDAAELHEQMPLLQLLQMRYRDVLGMLEEKAIGITVWKDHPAEEALDEAIRGLLRQVLK